VKAALTAVVLAALLGGCALSPEQEEWNRAHNVWAVPVGGTPGVVQSSGGNASPFNDKNYPDPNPHSASDDAQRAAYQANQQRQQEIKQGEDVENEEARKAGLGPSPIDGMHCTSTSSYSGSANAGTSTSSTSCHN